MTAVDQNDMLSFFKMLRNQIGIDLNLDKEYLLVTRLTPLSRAHGYPDLASYLKALTASGMVGALQQEAFEAMTTKETYFFRDLYPFEALKSEILPKIIEAKKRARQINIWSAASSTGQEAYSLAMLLNDQFPQLQSWHVRILGTDISEFALKKARSGIYSTMEVERGLTPQQIKNHFTKQNNNTFVLNDTVRKKVDFQLMNLNGNWLPMPPFDLVLIRNVLIYFDQVTKMNILRKIFPLLSENEGCLMLGASESILENNPFKQVNLAKASYYTVPKVLERV
jgi:chemotaxis protein methyltransferase CheR